MAPPMKRRNKYALAETAIKKKPYRFQNHLKVTVVILGIVCTILLAVVVSLLLKRCERGIANSKDSQVCLTVDCVRLSSMYLANMDPQVDPCEDFFQFTCGSFVKDNILRGSSDLIRDLGLNSIPLGIDKKLIKLLGQNDTTLYGIHSEAVRKLKDVYFSCYNSSGYDPNGAALLQKYIHNLGGWSLSGEYRDHSIDLERLLAGTQLNGDEGLFKTWVVANPFKDLIYQLRLQSPDRTSPSTSEYIADVVKMLGTETHSPLLNQRIKDIIDIERTILELTPTEEYRKNPEFTMDARGIHHIKRIFGNQFLFDRYLRLLLPPSVESPSEILVESIDFLRGVAKLLQNHTRIAVADYIIWTSVKCRLPYLSKPFSSIHEKYSRGFFSKADHCLHLTKTHFSQVLGAIYVQSYHDTSSNLQLSDMMSQLQRSFKDVVENVEWMKEETRNKTLEKLASMKRIVAYMEENIDAGKLDYLYRFHGPLDEKDIFKNVNNLKKGTYARQLSLLGQRETIVDAVSEQQAPHDTGATYASHQNTIIVWAGLLQFAFFEKRFPTVLKYGGLGFVIGHEIIHGFDNDGRNYDTFGRYAQWWDNETLSLFDEKARCFVDQYSKYKAVSYPYKKHRTYVDGNRTLGENIADNGAVKIAYSAYKNWSQNHMSEPRLPGINLTDDQMFFLGMATPLCTVEAPLLSLYNIRYDVHTQARYRVLGSLRNFEQFAKAFNCSKGSGMNPEEKCSLW